MKALFFEQHGGPEVLTYGELPDAKATTSQEVVVRVRAVALNHLDLWVRRGWEGLRIALPHIGGSDIAGDVVSSSNPNFPVGTKVVVNPGVSTTEDEWTRRGDASVSPGYKIIGEDLPGGFAEYVVVPIQNIYRFPETLSYEQACAPLLVGTTCWRMLFARAQLQPGESILVVGSGGGVNSLTMQIACAMGAPVYALCGSSEKMRRAEALGVTAAINYTTTPKWDSEILRLTQGRGVDVVIDNVGSKTFSQSLRAVARGGRIVTVGNTSGYLLQLDNRYIFTKQISILGSTMGSAADFTKAIEFMWRQKILPIIDSVEPLSKGAHMLARLEKGEQFGKIVLTPN